MDGNAMSNAITQAADFNGAMTVLLSTAKEETAIYVRVPPVPA
jgi:hypothetical protein